MNPDSYKQLPIVPPPRTQALSSTTFRPAPIDGSLTLPEMYDWVAEHSPEHPLFVYTDDDTGAITTIKWAEAIRAIHRAGRIVTDAVGPTIAATAPTVAILASAEQITYFTMLVGIVRAGFVVFPVSPRNSPTAVAHLLQQTGSAHLLIGVDPAVQELAAEAFEIMKKNGFEPPQSSPTPVFDELYPADPSTPFEPLSPIKPGLDDKAIIMHSSGSTAFPKPIVWSHYRVILLTLTPYFGDIDLTGLKLACHAVPLYHAMGIFLTTFAPTCGTVVATFKPHRFARTILPDTFIKASAQAQCDIMYVVPSFVEAWAKNPDHVKTMQNMTGVVYAGGPLAKEVGDELTAKGVKLCGVYGSSEGGILTPFMPKPRDSDWEYFTLSRALKPHFAPQEDGVNVELVLLPNQYEVPSVLNSTVEGSGAYSTSDVLAPHPTKAGLWKVYGRVDDQIMHSTGEKTNPGPLEHILNQDPHIHTSVMFGRGRFNAGVIIEPKPQFKFDPADQDKLVEFRKLIWPTVEKLNDFAPTHSRLFKEMIMVSVPAKPFTYTAKHTPRRHAIIKDYDEEIDKLYAAVDETTQSELAPPSSWDAKSSFDFVRAVVDKVLEHKVSDTEDFFQRGCDSLQATWIRNSLLHALRETTSINTRSIPGNFVYNNPSIASLAAFVSGLASPESPSGVSETERAIAAMKDIVEKYSKDFPQHSASAPAPERDVVFLTGTSGRLGACILASLVQTDGVERVYAVNRKSSTPIAERQKSILEELGYNADEIVSSPKVVFVETDVEADRLGLPDDTYEEIRKSVTHIMHNAWPVNFNLSLSSFEPSVRSVRRLIDFALASPHPQPPRLLFVSSVGVLRNIDRSQICQEGLVEPEIARGNGYSESKWASEQILTRASAQTPLRTVAVRVGQLTGSSISGAWKPAEWVPVMIRSSVYLKCLPNTTKGVSWVSVDAAAKALNEMRNSDIPNLHLGHPRPVPWPTVMEEASRTLNIPLVPYQQWFDLLKKSGEGLSADSEVEVMRSNPALKIMPHFEGGLIETEDQKEALGLPALGMSQACKVAPSLGPESLPSLSGEDVRKWIGYWKGIGFLP